MFFVSFNVFFLTNVTNRVSNHTLCIFLQFTQKNLKIDILLFLQNFFVFLLLMFNFLLFLPFLLLQSVFCLSATKFLSCGFECWRIALEIIKIIVVVIIVNVKATRDSRLSVSPSLTSFASPP